MASLTTLTPILLGLPIELVALGALALAAFAIYAVASIAQRDRND